MTSPLQALRAELEQFGAENDRANGERWRRMLNITPATGEFLSLLVRAMGAQRILEIGTSNGYSTLWLADAALAVGGSVTTIERSAYKVELASANFARSGIAHGIMLVQSDARAYLKKVAAGSLDLIFLDAERPEYVGWWRDVRAALRPGGLLVVDNATSHPAELADFVALVAADPAFVTSTVPIGNGEFLAVKAPQP